MRLRDLMHKSQNPGGPTGLPGLPMATPLNFVVKIKGENWLFCGDEEQGIIGVKNKPCVYL